MTDHRTGTGKVVAEATALPTAAAVQLPLLGGPEAVPFEAENQRRGRGRPAGAENRTTRDLRAFLGATYRHPLVTLARIQAQDPLELARTLGCKPMEALDRITRAAEALAPYMAGKLAAEDYDGNTVTPMLILGDVEASRAALREAYDGVAGGPLVDITPEDAP